MCFFRKIIGISSLFYDGQQIQTNNNTICKLFIPLQKLGNKDSTGNTGLFLDQMLLKGKKIVRVNTMLLQLRCNAEKKITDEKAKRKKEISYKLTDTLRLLAASLRLA